MSIVFTGLSLCRMIDYIIAQVAQSSVLAPYPEAGLISGGLKSQSSNLVVGLSDMASLTLESLLPNFSVC